MRTSRTRTVTRTKNPRRRLERKPAVILTAERGRTVLRYDGKHFSSRGKAQRFATLSRAAAVGRRLLRRHRVLRSYRLYVRRA